MWKQKKSLCTKQQEKIETPKPPKQQNQPFECPICHKKLHSKTSNYRRHMVKHEKKVKVWQCNDCERSMSSKYNFQIHANRAHKHNINVTCTILWKDAKEMPVFKAE